jgi:hypothetical protein
MTLTVQRCPFFVAAGLDGWFEVRQERSAPDLHLWLDYDCCER